MKLQDCIWNLQALKFVSSLKFQVTELETLNLKNHLKQKNKMKHLTFTHYTYYACKKALDCIITDDKGIEYLDHTLGTG
jgi:hypothetical protein